MPQARSAEQPPPAVLLMGPTASGKTLLSVALARSLPCEIVSVDSSLIYRHMDIGTAKPDPALLSAAPHHLIDILDPDQSYSAARFRQDALRLMSEITARGCIPLLAGGTMLYFKALTEGLSELPPADPEVRVVINALAQAAGWPALHAELARVDPETAGRLSPNDAQRIQRALEVYYVTGTPLSELFKRPKQADFPYRAIPIALVPGSRELLALRIARRFEAMLERGLIDEVKWLKEHYQLDLSMPSMRCVGYRQAWKYLTGEYSLAVLRERGIAATRQLAKRQLTWLRAMEGAAEFDCFAPDLFDRVLGYVHSQL